MATETIVVGIDASAAGLNAARSGVWLAERMKARCRLVHAVADAWMMVPPPEIGLTGMGSFQRASVNDARSLMLQTLAGMVPPAVADLLEAAPGRSASVVSDAAHRDNAKLVVLGGKHHHGLERLLGSTVTDLLRMTDVPLLVSDRGMSRMERILVAADLSDAAIPAIRAAQDWAEMFNASLRLLHVAEAMPSPGSGMPRSEEDFQRAADDVRRRLIPHLTLAGSSIMIRPGPAAAVIATEAEMWNADLVVVGSHGKGFVDRLILGSTSEQMLRLLVAPTLVVPSGTVAKREITPARTYADYTC